MLGSYPGNSTHGFLTAGLFLFYQLQQREKCLERDLDGHQLNQLRQSQLGLSLSTVQGADLINIKLTNSLERERGGINSSYKRLKITIGNTFLALVARGEEKDIVLTGLKQEMQAHLWIVSRGASCSCHAPCASPSAGTVKSERARRTNGGCDVDLQIKLSLRMAEVWNWMIFKDPANPTHSGFLWDVCCNYRHRS